MKKQLLSLLFSGLYIGMSAQVSIPNGAFETWNTFTMYEPMYYWTANQEVGFGQFANWPVQQSTDAQLNNYAIRMETQTNGQDTMFGYFTNGDPGSGEGGIPYAARPTALTGYWKGDIQAGDTAILFVMFKLGGNMISIDVHQFYGTQNSYTMFTLPINLPPIVTPDSVMIAAASSNAFVFNGIPGSWIQLDNIAFTGVATQPTMLNGDFELWNSQNMYTLVDWTLAGDSATRTTDSYQGQYAVSLETYSPAPNAASPSYLTNGYFQQNGPPIGGFPYSNQIDTLVCYYKFNGPSDSAFILALFTGPVAGDTAYVFSYLTNAATYTMVEVPFNIPFVPDSVAITVGSDIYNPAPLQNLGNVLKVDEIQFKSQALTTGIAPNWQAVSDILLYPNPSDGSFTLAAKSGYTGIIVTDLAGRVVYNEQNETPVMQTKQIDLTAFGSGTYIVTVMNGSKIATKKVVVN